MGRPTVVVRQSDCYVVISWAKPPVNVSTYRVQAAAQNGISKEITECRVSTLSCEVPMNYFRAGRQTYNLVDGDILRI